MNGPILVINYFLPKLLVTYGMAVDYELDKYKEQSTLQSTFSNRLHISYRLSNKLLMLAID